jgi:hypothetical protein
MTKLVTLRVVIAVDDEVELKHIKPRLQALIAAAGTERVGQNGAAEPDGDGGRVHWSTADVLQGPDGRSGVPGARRGRKAEPPAGQPDLIRQ